MDAWCFTRIDSMGNKCEVSFTTHDFEAWDARPKDMFIQFLRGSGYTVGFDELVYENKGGMK